MSRLLISNILSKLKLTGCSNIVSIRFVFRCFRGFLLLFGSLASGKIAGMWLGESEEVRILKFVLIGEAVLFKGLVGLFVG